MATEPLAESTPDAPEDRTPYAGVLRYYELAKRAEWQVRDLPWGEAPPLPEYKGSPQKIARRRDMWRSVLTQQLQADELEPTRFETRQDRPNQPALDAVGLDDHEGTFHGHIP